MKTNTVSQSKTAEVQLAEWVSLYAELGITLNPADVVIPPHRDGFNRLIVVPKGMTPQKAFDLCAGKFPCWKYTEDSLDDVVITNDRDAKNGAYAVWVRDTVEADEVLKSKSANDLAEAGIKGITLCERLLYELKYFTEAGKHLDIENWTLCSGSRCSDGSVPGVSWDDGRLWVNWDSRSLSRSSLRARAVSLEP